VGTGLTWSRAITNLLRHKPCCAVLKLSGVSGEGQSVFRSAGKRLLGNYPGASVTCSKSDTALNSKRTLTLSPFVKRAWKAVAVGVVHFRILKDDTLEVLMQLVLVRICVVQVLRAKLFIWFVISCQHEREIFREVILLLFFQIPRIHINISCVLSDFLSEN
jgi:hypothetical protein